MNEIQTAPLQKVIASYVPIVVEMILQDDSPQLKEYIRTNGKAMAEGAIYKEIYDFTEQRLKELVSEVERYKQKKW